MGAVAVVAAVDCAAADAAVYAPAQVEATRVAVALSGTYHFRE